MIPKLNKHQSKVERASVVSSVVVVKVNNGGGAGGADWAHIKAPWIVLCTGLVGLGTHDSIAPLSLT